MPIPARITRQLLPWLVMWLGICLTGLAAEARGELRVTDDAGRMVVLAAPARRVVSLSPHLTEILFHVGAGERVVGTVGFSDYPPDATALPRVGNAGQVDLERIVALRPDLVVAWQSGNPLRQVQRIENLGIPVYINETRTLDDLAASLERISLLTGTGETGTARAAELRERSHRLAHDHAGRPPVRLFYQIWDKPLMTISDDHLIGQVISLCGGVNVFGTLSSLAPRVSHEAVLAADPEVIISGGSDEHDRAWLDGWRRWNTLTAVQRDNLFLISPSLIQRHTPRILEGATLLCELLDHARARRPEGSE